METKEELKFECCPPFNPELWNDKLIVWENKKFIKDKVFTLFYMPLNFGGAMKRMNKAVGLAGAQTPDWLGLSDHTSQWNMDVYLAVDRVVPNAVNTSISGKFFCKVYEGPFKDTGIWTKDFEKTAGEKNLVIKKMYMWYTTCPKCAKKYGKNYTVIFGQTE